MSLTITQTKSAVGPNITSSFAVVGGTGPYTWSVIAGGAGGTIDPSTGVYTAPAAYSLNPLQRYDTVQVQDSTSPTPLTATAKILVGSAFHLLQDIIVTQIPVDSQRVAFWDQKEFQPSDTGIYVVLAMSACKIFGNGVHPAGTPGGQGQGPGWNVAEQFVNVAATIDINVISRDNSALFQKELVLMALKSPYAEQQQEANSFFIGTIPGSFQDLSGIDGAAIPYRYLISIKMQYTVSKTSNPDYFDTFPAPTVVTNP